jgi:hypothetical protein
VAPFSAKTSEGKCIWQGFFTSSSRGFPTGVNDGANITIPLETAGAVLSLFSDSQKPTHNGTIENDVDTSPTAKDNENHHGGY